MMRPDLQSSIAYVITVCMALFLVSSEVCIVTCGALIQSLKGRLM